jgi:ParB/RepB/Spo0J family partition protein
VTTNPTAQYREIAPSQIAPSPTNPRRTFKGIDELAASAKAKGIISPITVRPHPEPTAVLLYELVAGERRWRAAKKAGLAVIPCIVRELTDLEVREVQLIENGQRDDVHPLEEADGYEALITEHHYTVEQIASKVHKSVSTIRARRTLTNLADYPREAFLDGTLNASIALMIARIADATLHEQATKDVLGITALEHVQGPAVNNEPNAQLEDLADTDSPLAVARRTQTTIDEDGAPSHEPIPMSVREAQIHLQRRYMLRLSLAKFDTSDQSLVKAAGSCSACEFRTGNQRELFEDVTSADVCTKPSCFEQKTHAAWDVKAAAAESAGVKVLTADSTDKVFTPTAQIRATSPFVDPKSPVPMDLLPAGTKKAPTWEKLLGRKLGSDDAPYVLAQDAAGAAHELLDKKKAVEVLREAGKIDKPVKPPTSSSSSKSGDPMKDDREKEEIKRKQWARAVESCLLEATKKIDELDADKDWWRWVLMTTLSGAGRDFLVGVEGTIEELITKKRLGPEELLTLMLLNMNSNLPSNVEYGMWQDPAKNEELHAGLEVLGIDYAEHLKRIKDSDKEAAKAEAKLAKEKEPAAPKKPAKKGKAKS